MKSKRQYPSQQEKVLKLQQIKPLPHFSTSYFCFLFFAPSAWSTLSTRQYKHIYMVYEKAGFRGPCVYEYQCLFCTAFFQFTSHPSILYLLHTLIPEAVCAFFKYPLIYYEACMKILVAHYAIGYCGNINLANYNTWRAICYDWISGGVSPWQTWPPKQKGGGKELHNIGNACHGSLSEKAFPGTFETHRPNQFWYTCIYNISIHMNTYSKLLPSFFFFTLLNFLLMDC